MAGVSAPVNTTAPTISPTSGVVGAVLTTTNGSWSGSPTSYQYQWTRGGVAISGATSATYTTVSADAGQVVRSSVRAFNASGGAAAGYTASSNSITPTGDAPSAPIIVSGFINWL